MLKHFAVVLLVLLPVLYGCKEEAPVEQIRILGNAPIGAAVGSELRFELGIDGGEGPYQFTLSNQPGWLAVEFNDNPLRPGVVIRGVPAVTGGQTLDDLITVVYRNILLTVSDGRSIATREFEMTVNPNGLTIGTNSRQEAEQEDRPTREVLNPDTRQFEPENIAMCRVDEAGQPLITEEDMSYWLALIEDLETVEAGGTLSESEQAELTTAFGSFRPRLAYLNLQIGSAVVADSRFRFVIAETVGSNLTPGQDFMTSVRRANGETLDLGSGLLAIPADETLCPIPIFVNDDREAEDTESLTLQIENISDHDYLPDTVAGTLEVTDNEPTPGFVTAVGSVTETALQEGFASETQAPGTVFRMTVKMNEVPLQDQTADHVVTGRLVFGNAAGSGVFATVSGPEEVSGSTADVVADTSPDYLAPIENGVEVSFYEETREVDGETVTEWVSQRELYFYAPANEDVGALVDDFVTLTWERSSTSFENEATHLIRVNEWVDTVQRVLPLASRAVAVRSGLDGGVYVGYEYEEAGVTVAEIVHYDRLGQATVSLPLRFPGQSIELVDFVVREKGIPEPTTSEPDVLQDLFVALNVNALLAPPAEPDGAGSLGGQDFIVGLYRRINRVGDFALVWNRQLGSVWDDTATSLHLNASDSLYVGGVTTGDFGFFVNNGGTDGFLMLLNDSGVVLNSRLYGTKGDDAFLDITADGAFNAFFAGYAGSETEQGAAGGGLDILTASFSDEFSIRRINQFGGIGDQIMTDAESLSIGFFAAGITDQASLGFPPGQDDIFISYQRTASQLEALLEIGTATEDTVHSVATVGFQGIAAGSTGGSLFEDSVLGGGTDWWMASYDVVQPDPNDNQRTLEVAWQIQGGDSRNEAIKSLTATTFGKLFKLTEVEDGSNRIVQTTPFALTDGRELSELP